MKSRSSDMLCLSCGLLLLACVQPRLFAQAPSDRPTRQSLMEQRNAFMERVRESSTPCDLPPARIVLTGRASYGRYDPKTNVLHTPAWQQLKLNQRTIFYQLAGPGASEAQVREVFESNVHRWVFVRELGRWWQTCRGANKGRTRYELEIDADRIAAAYWRETDATLMEGLAAGFRGVLKGMPVQMPAGETPERYFNEHFDTIAASPSYPWFQAFMIANVEAEDPLPSFRDTLVEGASEPSSPPSR